jgi:hypothetical protein
MSPIALQTAIHWTGNAVALMIGLFIIGHILRRIIKWERRSGKQAGRMNLREEE